MRLPICAALLSTLALPAGAQQQRCAPFDVVERFHAERLQETRVAQGMERSGSGPGGSPLMWPGESWDMLWLAVGAIVGAAVGMAVVSGVLK